MFYAYHVIQDGRDFYLYDGSALIAVVAYPNMIKDYDLEKAQQAREWFVKQMRQWGIVVSF